MLTTSYLHIYHNVFDFRSICELFTENTPTNTPEKGNIVCMNTMYYYRVWRGSVVL